MFDKINKTLDMVGQRDRLIYKIMTYCFGLCFQLVDHTYLNKVTHSLIILTALNHNDSLVVYEQPGLETELLKVIFQNLNTCKSMNQLYLFLLNMGFYMRADKRDKKQMLARIIDYNNWELICWIWYSKDR